MNPRVIVVGGGAAGLMAAGRAAVSGASVILLEKGSRVGRKLLLTGNGRCNLTNLAPTAEFPAHLGPNGAFMRNALHRFDARALRTFFHERDVPTCADEQGRIFPVSNKSADVVQALESYCRMSGVELRTNTAVTSLQLGKVLTVITKEGQSISGESVILATGGKSWAQTGSNGEGYRWLERAGHTVSSLHPGLVPLVAAEDWLAELEGLSCANVGISAAQSGRRITRTIGDLLFTRDGLSGPAVLDLSRTISPLLAAGPVNFKIDFFPLENTEQVADRLAHALTAAPNSQVAVILQDLLPRRLAQRLCAQVIAGRDTINDQATQDQPLRVNQLSASQRVQLVELLKGLPVTIISTRPFREAFVTVGGVSCAEVDPLSFASKKVNGLYITGELLDIAGETGGYNLQCAFTSGWLSGLAAAGAQA